MSYYFRICLRYEAYSFFFKPFAQSAEVFYDAVVNYGYVSCGVSVRVGVYIGRLAVCRPAGVTYAGCVRAAFTFEQRFEIGESAFGFYDAELFVFEIRYACAVVAAVFQFMKPAQKHGENISVAYVSYNTTHVLSLLNLI